MTLVVRVVMIVLLSTTAWRVYSLRAYFAEQEPETAQIARLQARLDSIPLRLPDLGLNGASEPEASEIIDRSGANAHISYSYRLSDSMAHSLYVGSALFLRGYFHAPKGCLLSRGWEVLEDSTEPFDVYPSSTSKPTFRRLVMSRGLEQLLIYYWFQSGSRVGDDVSATHYFRFFDLLRNEPVKPVHIVSIYTPIQAGKAAAAEEQARRFLNAIGPHLRAALE